jgi:hypothetical protein
VPPNDFAAEAVGRHRQMQQQPSHALLLSQERLKKKQGTSRQCLPPGCLIFAEENGICSGPHQQMEGKLIIKEGISLSS